MPYLFLLTGEASNQHLTTIPSSLMVPLRLYNCESIMKMQMRCILPSQWSSHQTRMTTTCTGIESTTENYNAQYTNVCQSLPVDVLGWFRLFCLQQCTLFNSRSFNKTRVCKCIHLQATQMIYRMIYSLSSFLSKLQFFWNELPVKPSHPTSSLWNCGRSFLLLMLSFHKAATFHQEAQYKSYTNGFAVSTISFVTAALQWT